MTMKPLSALPGKDHEVMARRIESVVAASGAACLRRVDGFGKPRSISLQIVAPGGLRGYLGFNEDAGRLHALHFLHWNIESDSHNKLRPGFGGVNTNHFCKATHVAYGFEALCEQLELALRLAATGEAYQTAAPEPDVRRRAPRSCDNAFSPTSNHAPRLATRHPAPVATSNSSA